jgi:hypothetical protein
MFALCSLNVKLLVFVFIVVGSETGPARFHYVMLFTIASNSLGGMIVRVAIPE